MDTDVITESHDGLLVAALNAARKRVIDGGKITAQDLELMRYARETAAERGFGVGEDSVPGLSFLESPVPRNGSSRAS